MRPGTFFPFRTGNAISLTITESSSGTTSAGSVIDAFSEKPDTFTVRVRIAIDLDVAEKLALGSPEEHLVALLRIRSISSQTRSVIPFEDLADRDYELEFDRLNWAGTISVSAVLVTNEDLANDGSGAAVDRGAVVAWSDEINIHVDPPRSSLPGDYLDVRWLNFSDDENLSRWKSHLFSLTIDTPPRILLNSDVPLAYAVLSSKGTSGRKARIRDVTFFQIAHQAWTSIIANAIDNYGEVIDPDSDLSPREDLAQLEEHEQRILEDWAPYLYSGLDDESSLDRLHEAAGSRRVDDLIIGRIPHAIQQRLRTYRGFEGLVKDAGLFAEGDGG